MLVVRSFMSSVCRSATFFQGQPIYLQGWPPGTPGVPGYVRVCASYLARVLHTLGTYPSHSEWSVDLIFRDTRPSCGDQPASLLGYLPYVCAGRGCPSAFQYMDVYSIGRWALSFEPPAVRLFDIVLFMQQWHEWVWRSRVDANNNVRQPDCCPQSSNGS